MHLPVVAQVLGYLAFCISIVAFSSKSDTRTKVLMGCAQIVLIFHFYLLGAFTASALKCVSATRDFSSLLSFRKKLFPVFVVIYIAIFPLTQESWVSLLPYAGAIIALFALYLTDGLRMRTILLSATTLWMIHNILLGSWGPVLMEVFVLTSNLVTIHRLRIDKKSLAKTQS